MEWLEVARREKKNSETWNAAEQLVETQISDITRK